MVVLLVGRVGGCSPYRFFYVGCPKQQRKRRTKVSHNGQPKGPSPLKILKVCGGITECIECDSYVTFGV